MKRITFDVPDDVVEAMRWIEISDDGVVVNTALPGLPTEMWRTAELRNVAVGQRLQFKIAALGDDWQEFSFLTVSIDG